MNNSNVNKVKTDIKNNINVGISNAVKKGTITPIKSYLNNDTDNLNLNQSETHSGNSYSDSENIYINFITRDTVNGLRNTLDSKDKDNNGYYKYYCEHIKGYKIIGEKGSNSIYYKDEDGKYKYNLLKVDNEEDREMVENINKLLKKESFNLPTDSIKDYTIEEVYTDSYYGYDAIVYKSENGEYIIDSASTNANQGKDILSIAYSMSEYLFGDTTDSTLNYVFNTLIQSSIMSVDGEDIHDMMGNSSIKELIAQGKINAEEVKMLRDGQARACENLVKKYLDKNENVILNGYSLGGGITQYTYAKLKEDERYKDKLDNIKSVCTYNGFTAFGDYDTMKGLNGDPKVKLYCTEGDFVSIFNNNASEYNKSGNLVMIKADNLKKMKSIRNLSEYIVGSNGNHAFSHIIKDNFDENGNLIELGEFNSVNYHLSDMGARNIDTSADNPRFGDTITGIIDAELNSNEKLMVAGQDLMPYLKDNVDLEPLRKYLNENNPPYDKKLYKIVSNLVFDTLEKILYEYELNNDQKDAVIGFIFDKIGIKNILGIGYDVKLLEFSTFLVNHPPRALADFTLNEIRDYVNYMIDNEPDLLNEILNDGVLLSEAKLTKNDKKIDEATERLKNDISKSVKIYLYHYVEKTHTSFKNILQDFSDIGNDPFQLLSFKWLADTGATVSHGASSIFDITSNIVKNGASALHNSTGNLISKIVGIFDKEAGENVKDFFHKTSSTFGTIISTPAKVVSKGFDLLGDGLDYIGEKGKELVDSIEDVGGKVVSKIGDVGSYVFSGKLGEDIFDLFH